MTNLKRIVAITGLIGFAFLTVHCSGDDTNGTGDAGSDASEFDPNDIDGDGIPNDQDPDIDGDGIPNDQDQDVDGDGINNSSDNCPTMVNPEQDDTDEDGHGDECDNCPEISNPGQQDADNDGIGDHCDAKLDLPPLDGVITCAEQKSESTPIAANLYFVIDHSGSMDDSPYYPETAWNNAIDGMYEDIAAGQFNLGVAEFSGGGCIEPNELMAMETKDGPGDTTFVTDFYNAATISSPSGGTPTGEALRGVREGELYELTGDTEENRPKAVVLVTDGVPTECPGTGSDLSDGAIGKSLYESRQLAALSVPVYVLGFPGAQDDVMDAIAWAGNTANLTENVPWTSGGECTSGDDTDCWCHSENGDDYRPSGCWDWSDYGQIADPADRQWFPVDDSDSIMDALTDIGWRTTACILPMDDNEQADFGISAVKLIGAGECADSPGGDCYVPESGSNGYSIDGTTVRIYGNWCTYLITKVKADPEVAVEARIGCMCSGVEICADGVDNDCDGETDENCGVIIR